jgi:hypothetical protein
MDIPHIGRIGAAGRFGMNLAFATYDCAADCPPARKLCPRALQ